MEIITACILGFVSGAIVAICAMLFSYTKPVENKDSVQKPETEDKTEPEKLQEQFENLLNYNGRDPNGGV